MLWLAISLFFCWMIFREVWPHISSNANDIWPATRPISKSYVAAMLALALLFAWPPFKYWRFERYLSTKATAMAEGHPAHVHCNTIVDTLFDSNSLAAGHANWTTGVIVFQYPWCGRLMDYLSHPEKADRLEIASLNIFTHESMHVRGEHNEAITECQAVQRNYRAAKLLGVPDAAAKSTAMSYYTQLYMQRAGGQGFNAVYFSAQCAPGKALDERLDDSSWGPPG